jgi:hypothetical protein
LQNIFGKHQDYRSTRSAIKPALYMAGFVLLGGFVLSCSALNNIGVVQPLDICNCVPLELGLEYRHGEKHVPIPVMAPLEITIDTIYSWAQTDPGSLDPPRTGVELQVFHVAVAFLQEVSINGEDCDIGFEISQTADKNARRVIVETPVDSEFCSARKNIQSQLAQHGFRLDATHGGELPQALPMDVTGLAFEDFDHNAIGLGRGSAQVATVWELHPAIVTLLP